MNLLKLLFRDTKASPKAKAKKLLTAAKKGRLEQVHQLVESGTDANTRDWRGQTPLMLAASRGHADVVEYLAAIGANIDAQDRRGLTALIKCSDVRVIKLLLENGANPDARGKSGETWLMLSAWLGDAELTRLLLRRGANVNAVASKRIERIPTPSIGGGVNPVWVPRQQNAPYILGIATLEGTTALILAAAQGQTDVVRELLNAGANKGVVIGLGHTALSLAKLIHATYKDGGWNAPERVEAYRQTISELQMS